MKNATQEFLESGYPDFDATYLVDRTLKYLFEDKTRLLSDRVVRGVSFEELIGTLRVVQRDLKEQTELAILVEDADDKGYCYHCNGNGTWEI